MGAATAAWEHDDTSPPKAGSEDEIVLQQPEWWVGHSDITSTQWRVPGSEDALAMHTTYLDATISRCSVTGVKGEEAVARP